MIKWCYLGIISFNGSDRSGQILFWGFFCSDAKPKKAGKNILGQNFLRFSLAKWNQKTHHAKALNEPKCFIPPKLNVLCYDYSCLFFFLIEWHFEWISCEILFANRWNVRIFHVQKSIPVLSAKNLCEFNLNLLIVSIFLSNSLLVENIPQHFSSYYWTDSWIFFLPYQWDFSPTFTGFLLTLFFSGEEHFSFFPWWSKSSCHLVCVTDKILH